jgi:hypothetical protein
MHSRVVFAYHTSLRVSMNPRIALLFALLVLPLFASSERAQAQTKSWVQPTVSMEIHKAGGQTDTYDGIP